MISGLCVNYRGQRRGGREGGILPFLVFLKAFTEQSWKKIRFSLHMALSFMLSPLYYLLSSTD